MRKLFLVMMLLFASIVNFGQTNPQDLPIESNVGKVPVLDSTIVNDMKLLIVADRLYSKNGLIETLVNQASKEKAETGKIEKQAATQNLIDNLNADYSKYLAKFIKVDTVWVDSINVNMVISQITEWQNSVLIDPEIKNATTLGIWEEKDKELQKLKRYQRQILNR